MSNSVNVPIDQFQLAWCRVCAERGCSRSPMNNAVFDRRVQNWESNLFINVNRASDDDASFAHIRSKRFLPITVGDVRVQNFVTTPVAEVLEHKEKVELREVTKPEVKDEPHDQITEEPEPEPEPIKVGEQVIDIQHGIDNTPFNQGMTIGPENLRTKIQHQDDGDVFLEPGQTFTFGSDNE